MSRVTCHVELVLAATLHGKLFFATQLPTLSDDGAPENSSIVLFRLSGRSLHLTSSRSVDSLWDCSWFDFALLSSSTLASSVVLATLAKASARSSKRRLTVWMTPGFEAEDNAEARLREGSGNRMSTGRRPQTHCAYFTFSYQACSSFKQRLRS